MSSADPFASDRRTSAADDRFSFLHVDLNSFFASVEQQIHPEYRNRPLAVVPTFADTTVAIAASYEAKALGIKTGTRVGDMKKICPEIIMVQGDHTTYAEYSHRIHAAVERVCPVAHIPSIDEVTCQLMGREREPPNARRISLDIKQAIYDDVGDTMRCSIGMAPNRYLAKIASDMQKPDGLIGLLPSQLPRALTHLELRDLPGVGAKTEQMLIKKGITTMPQLLELDREGMHKLWNSVWGDRLYHWLRGHDTGDDGAPLPNEMQKSLGHSHVLGPDHRSPQGSWAIAHKLLHKAAMRLRMEKMCTGSLGVTIRYQLSRQEAEGRSKVRQHQSGIKHDAWGMEARFPTCQDTLSLLETLQKVWAQQPTGPEYQRPFFVGVTLGRLIPESEQQPTLFADADNRGALSRTLDKLNLKYGHTTLHFAGMLPARDSAPTRIAFTQIPVQYGVDYM
ncbi:nucleotidyltransferase/DNA polymerase involved in DNA repair [Terriglobus roseus DSM 18391]|uniref:Nucleotidyltransferase/DNA polymerase involved in DNA repair n=1 Tax=Terriglobus roseus (strain DSM 18391 / NRRL B-41598 / KBS 63) TaxID=926566 RepID=I3ZBE4_TERRK|nr:DNA-directed DNA polymerase [Terriglobus roseus]AFL86562.1 nucleotidyltransferase/DNA polymerase involved in DNA repair [Terriglobus roseus DSM 18391]